ncbi:3'-5' exonuclease isoform X2 [Ziziphus jujuba]|uniref:3'-5' exonuclease isoform X2 n=1 Tax=Ziziphus jujuba TaxID=326968 RepID=A0A6P6FL75_ZIZJJ|nr:3'-5' exonuclease isoform X2 [Ziziphus jujuba]
MCTLSPPCFPPNRISKPPLNNVSLPIEFPFIPEKYPEAETEGMASMDKHHHHPFREHEHHHRDHTSSVTAVSFKSDRDDEPFTNEDLQAIDAALQSASKRPRPSSSHNHDDDDNHNYGPDPPTGGGSRRRLPSSILASQEPNPFSLSTCRANLRMRYPVMKFGGQITYSRTVAEVEAAAMELLKTVEAKNREVGEAIVGFDIEWRPTFKKGCKKEMGHAVSCILQLI